MSQSPSKATMSSTRKPPRPISIKKRNEEDMYSMELGTMGIPREVAQLNQRNDFLFNSANKLGPGDYRPHDEQVYHKAPEVGFGKLP